VALDTLGDPNIRKRFGVKTGDAQKYATSGDHTVFACPTDRHIRLSWTAWKTPYVNTAEIEVAMRFGSNAPFYKWSMGVPDVFAHGGVREGAINEDLIINMSGAQTLYCLADLEVF
jgi:hypothetical protein